MSHNTSRLRIGIVVFAAICLLPLIGGRADAQTKGGDVWSCGGMNERPCSLDDAGEAVFVTGNGNFGCDRGLKEENNVCVNDKRRQNVGIDFRQTPLGRALAMQQRLNLNTPYGYLSDITVHNSYENHADGYPAGSHHYSITEMLDAGFRQVELDVYADGTSYPRLCHGLCSPADRYFSSALKEIRDWMKEPGHEREVVVIFIQDEFDDDKIDLVDESITKILADDPKIGVNKNDGPQNNNGSFNTSKRWPTRAELLTAGTRTVFISQGGLSIGQYIKKDRTSGPIPAIDQLIGYPTCKIGGNTVVPVGTANNGFGIFDQYPEGTAPTAAQLQILTECALDSLKINHLLSEAGGDPDRLRSAVWTWADNEPAVTARGTAVQLHAGGGTDTRIWHAHQTSDEGSYLCRDTDPNYAYDFDLQLAEASGRVVKGTWLGGFAACERMGLQFYAPRNGYESLLARDLMIDEGQTRTWTPVQTDGSEDGWDWRGDDAEITVSDILGFGDIYEGAGATLSIAAEFVVGSVTWDFGDGASETRNGAGPAVFHTWDAAGTYTVTATLDLDSTTVRTLTKVVVVKTLNDLPYGPQIKYVSGIPSSLKEGEGFFPKFQAQWPIIGIRCGAGLPEQAAIASSSEPDEDAILGTKYTATFSCVVPGGSAPALPISVRAGADTLTIVKSFSVPVGNDSRTPTLWGPSTATVVAGDTFTAAFTVEDVDGEPLTVTITWPDQTWVRTARAPEAVLLERVFQTAGSFSVGVTVTDGQHSATETIAVTVTARAPEVLSATGSFTPRLYNGIAAHDEFYDFVVRAANGGSLTLITPFCGAGNDLRGSALTATNLDGSRRYTLKCRFVVEGPATVMAVFQDSLGGTVLAERSVTVIGPLPPQLVSMGSSVPGPFQEGDLVVFYFKIRPTISGPTSFVDRTCGSLGTVAHEPVVTYSDFDGVREFGLQCRLGAAGSTAVSMRFRGGNGDEVTFTQEVSISPGPPTLTVEDFSVAATGSLTAISFNGHVTAQGAVQVTCNPTDGGEYAIGQTTVTCAASGVGGTTTKSFTVTVVDTTAPEMNVPADITVSALGTRAVVTFSVSASDAVDGAGVPIACSPASGSSFPVGTTQVTCSATDTHGNRSADKMFNVTVTDGGAPALSLPANITKEAEGPGGATVTFAASATDNVDANVAVSCSPSSGALFEIKTTTVECSATDSSHNTKTGSFTVTVVDTTAPALTVPADITVPAIGTSAVVTFGASASDLVDGTGVPVTCSPASGATFLVGKTPVTCSATDQHGNRSEDTRFDVTVQDSTAPSISVADVIAEAIGPNGAAVAFAASAIDAVDPQPAVVCVNGSILPDGQVSGSPVAPGDTFALGVSRIACVATDASNNTSTATFTITVRDSIAPAVSYSGNTGSYHADQTVNIRCTAVDSGSGVAATTCADIVGPAAMFAAGPNVYSATATDAAGNTGHGSTSFTVVVSATALQSLVSRFSTSADVAAGLNAKLAAAAKAPNANARAGQLGAFANQVRAQTGKALTTDAATTLLRLMAALN